MQRTILTFFALLQFFIIFGCDQKQSYNFINVSVEEANHLLTIFVNEEPVAINYSSGIGSININPYLITGSNTIRISGRRAPGIRPNAISIIKIFSHDGKVFGENYKLLNKIEFNADSFVSKDYFVTTMQPNITGFSTLEPIPKDTSDEEIINYLNDYLMDMKRYFVAKKAPDHMDKHEKAIIETIFKYRDFTHYIAQIEDIKYVRGLKTVLFYSVNGKLIYYAGHSDKFKGKIGETVYSLSCDMIRFGYKDKKLEKIW